MSAFRTAYRLILLCLIVFSGSLLTVLFLRGSLPPESVQGRITRWWHRSITRSLGVSIRVYGTAREQATLFVSNHVSSFDIIALGSILPVRFLSKAEVRSWPLLGWLATRAGTLYIPRGGMQAAETANSHMAAALSNNQNVMLFAEGTTTDGNVRKFHSRLLQSAIDSGSHVQPVAIRYPCPQGNKVHPAAQYYDDMSFLDLTRRMLAAKGVEVEIYFAEPVSAHNKSRDELARYAETEVRNLIRASGSTGGR